MQLYERIGSEEIARALERMADQVALEHRETPRLGILGIADGGIVLSRRLARLVGERLNKEIPVGVIDVLFHRDDISTKPIPKATTPTSIPFDIENATVILADDVTWTGRTARAAMSELFDQGRPYRVELAALFDRGGRLLPIRADFSGFIRPLQEAEQVSVILFESDSSQDEIQLLRPETP